MLNYMKAELYKLTRRKYPYITLAVMLALETALVLMIILPDMGNNHVTFANAIGMVTTLLPMGFYFTLFAADMVFSEQYKYNTLKNEVSFGLSRTRIYLGKLAVQCLTSLALCALMLGYYIALCYLVMPHSSADGETLAAVVRILLQMLPLWLGAQALTNMALFVCRNSTVASFGVVLGVFVALPEVIQLMSYFISDKFRLVYSLMLTVHPNNTFTLPALNTPLATTAIGVGWFVGSTLLGIALLRKKEIS